VAACLSSRQHVCQDSRRLPGTGAVARAPAKERKRFYKDSTHSEQTTLQAPSHSVIFGGHLASLTCRKYTTCLSSSLGTRRSRPLHQLHQTHRRTAANGSVLPTRCPHDLLSWSLRSSRSRQILVQARI